MFSLWITLVYADLASVVPAPMLLALDLVGFGVAQGDEISITCVPVLELREFDVDFHGLILACGVD